MAKGTRGGSNDVTLDLVATDELTSGTFNGMKAQVAKLGVGALGAMEQVDASNPLPVVQTGALPAGTNGIGKLTANSGVDIGDVDVTSSALPTGAATAAKQPAFGTAGTPSVDVVSVQGVASGTPQPVTQALPTTGITSAVNDTASSTTLLSSDATRKGFRIWNDSTSTLYVKYGTTASLTDCTVVLPPSGYLEENFFSGRVDGIWSSDASGAARITALT